MRYRQQSSTGDYTLGLPPLENSPDAVALAIRTRLALSLGEYFLDLSQGTPWWDGVMEKYTSNYDAIIKDRILGTPGVTSITSYTSSVSNYVPTVQSSPNLIPDSDTFASWNNTSSLIRLVQNFAPGLNGYNSNAWCYYGTGSPSSYNFPYSRLISVVPGQLYQLSCFVDPTFVTDGELLIALYNPAEFDGSGYGGFGIGAGYEPGDYYIDWTCPAGVTQLVVIVDTDDATVQAGMPVFWSQPMLTPVANEDTPQEYVPGKDTVTTGFTYTPSGRALNVSCTVDTLYSGQQALELSLPLTPAGVLYPNSALQNPPNPNVGSFSMAYRPLSESGDYVIGQPLLKNTPETVAQAVMTRLKLITGEYWLNLTVGMPWLNIIGQRVSSAYYDPIIQQVILGTPGVTQVTSYSSSVTGRNLSVICSIDTLFGSTVVASVVAIP
jgi:hypothetical protein